MACHHLKFTSFLLFFCFVSFCNAAPDDFEAIVLYWRNGVEGSPIYCAKATFGAQLPLHADKKKSRFPAVLTNPSDGCSNSSTQLTQSVALSTRGECEYGKKAQLAQLGGAAASIIINDEEEAVPMSDTAKLDIRIPVVQITKSDGDMLSRYLAAGDKLEVLIYCPEEPAVDPSVMILWVIAVFSIVCAGIWPDLVGCDENDERYNELSPKTSSTKTNDSSEEVVDINVFSAVFFVISASALLLVMYFIKSSWFIYVLIVLFCIGGIEGMHTCITGILQKRCRSCDQKKINLPLFGEVSILSLSVLIFSVAFAIIWAINREATISWVGQDVLAMCFMITVLQLVRLPNIKVATVLLSCAFFYDIFWVFISPFIFKTSVMISVAKGENTGGEIPMVMKFPRVMNPYGGTSVLGFGDIIFPGLLTTFSYRFDKAKRKGLINGYFLYLVIGYAIGLLLTYLGMYIMNGHGQPALFYLVPCTLGTTLVLGCIRGELKDLWSHDGGASITPIQSSRSTA